MADQLLDVDSGANGPDSAPPADDAERPITINRSELEKIIAAAVRSSRQEFESDSGSEDGAEDQNPTNTATVAPITSATELLDEQQVQKCDPVSEAMAHTIRTRLKERMPSEVLDKNKDRYKSVPENMVAFVKETSINQELYHGLPQWAKANDKRLKEVEELLLLTIKSMVTVADKIHIESRQNGELAADAGQLVDSLSLASQATYKLNMYRRQSLTHHLSRNYSPLKYSEDPVGDGLLFSDLNKALKNAKELSSVTKAVDSKNGKRRVVQPYKRKRKSHFKGNNYKNTKHPKN